MAGQSLSQKTSSTLAQTKSTGTRNAPATSEADSDQPIRLQKFLSSCGIASRRKAEELIAAGRVSVNGQIVLEMGTRVIPTKDEVRFDGRVVGEEKRGLIMFHKPDGVISSKSDPQGRKTVMD